MLFALGTRAPDGSPAIPHSPIIPLLDTTLLTNAPGEPRLGSQILTEVESATSIEVVMAFVRTSGIRPLLPALAAHCALGRPLRLLTTTYTGSTEAKALDLLVGLGAEVRVSYDITSTRLHAKAWMFHRRDVATTAYVGSSNLTHSAQVAGMEWNVRVSGARNPDVIDKMRAVFDSYWESGDFVEYDSAYFAEAMDGMRSATGESPVLLSPLELRLDPFQERLLELIAVARQQGQHRNLLVSATGTGKTVMAAVDYARLAETLPRARVLFVAHREEILEQSRSTFRYALRDHAFGEKWVGRSRPARFDHVFASIQSLNASDLTHLDRDHFDVVIVDEFHHAAAPSYTTLLQHVEPVELLGLTATPERSDGLPILTYFGDRISAELRLWDAIDQHHLTPFMYYGIHDGMDLRDIPWRRGRGYDTDALSTAYTSDDAWARVVLKELLDRVDNVSTMRCLGFCVSVQHAQFMADHFQRQGIDAVAVWGDSKEEDRRGALRDLAAGRIQVVFSVDLFNEGVDVPTVDVVLMLRPTESATLFLQQLGRGLRKAAGKTMCLVLDFVGTHRKEFRFDRRYRALLGGSRKDLERSIADGFPFLPTGCHMELDAVASEVVLGSLRNAIPSRWASKVEELRALSRDTPEISLASYLEGTDLDLADVVSEARGWSDLREAAGLSVEPPGPNEQPMRRGVGRSLHIDDMQRIDSFRSLLGRAAAPKAASLGPLDARLARMLVANVSNQVLGKGDSLQVGLDLVWSHPQVRRELVELLDVLETKIDHVHSPAIDAWPLQVHSRYTRVEILAAVGEGENAKTPPWREGAYYAKEARADLLAFTLDKTSGQFSPTTRYRDYAISRQLIHWESQSRTAVANPTGQRYLHHAQLGSSVLLFARTHVTDRSFWFLGPATYVSHENERPIAITWKLEHSLPGDLFASFAAAVA